MNRLILCFFSFALATSSFSQIPQLNGFILDKESGESIQGAIVTDSASFLYTYSNREGYYNLGLSSGKHIVVFTASGYEKQSFTLDVYNSREMNVELVKLEAEENDTNSNLHHTINDYRSGHTAPLASQVRNMPALLCAQDPIKFLQYLPGVNGGIEGLAGIYVRGGNADQNLVTMDGLPVYGNGHIFGFLSNFNSDQVRDIQFYRGVMPARYGGRAGSAMDVSMIDGGRSNGHGSFTSDLLNLNLNFNGPLNRSGTTTGSFGFRRSWLDLFFKHSGANFLYYNLHDFNGKIVFRPSEKDKISVWVYNGRDKFNVKFTTSETDSLNVERNTMENIAIVWQNTLAGVNYSRRISQNHYGNFLVGMTRYTYNSPYKVEASVISDTSVDEVSVDAKQQIHLTDFIGKANFELGLNGNNNLRYGLELINHNFRPDVQYIKIVSNNTTRLDSVFGSANVQNAQEVSAYGEFETNLAAGMKLNVGGRLWFFAGKEKKYLRPEPRVFISQLLQDKKAIKFGFSIANQGIHQLSSVNGNLPSDVWFPTSQNVTPQQNIQLTGGFYQPWRAGIEFSLDLYYKWMNGITDLVSRDAGLLPLNYWETMLAQGKGTAYGLEALVMKKTGRLSGLFSYAYSLSNRTVEGVNFGESYAFRWDRRHKGVLQGVYIINDEYKINFALVIMSGNAVSVPSGKYVTADGTFIYDYSEKNNYRMPLYKRLDIGFTKEIDPNPRSQEKRFWGMNIYNVLNFKNPLFVTLDRDANGVLKAYGFSFFPFIPSAFYRWEF